MNRLRALILLALLLTACSRSAAPGRQETPPTTLPPMTASAPGPTTGPRAQALALIAKGDYKGAEPLLSQAVAENPQDADAWNDLSLVQANLERWADAVTSAQKALALKPDMVYAKYNLGTALLHTDDWEKGKPYLDAAVQAQPDRPEPLDALGQWYQMDANLYQAEQSYTKAAAMGYGPAKKRLADLKAEISAPWDAVTAGTPNGTPVAPAAVAGQKVGKRLVQTLDMGPEGRAELYADPSQVDLLVLLSSGLGYAVHRTPAGEPAPPRLEMISTAYGPHLLVLGEDGRMSEGWILIPQSNPIANALHARMDFGITQQGDGVKLSYRKYKEGGGYIAQASFWRYNPKSRKYEVNLPNTSGTQVITSRDLCNNYPIYLPLTGDHRTADGFLAYDAEVGRWGRIDVTGGPYTTLRGIRVGDAQQRVIQLYGSSPDGNYPDPPYEYTRFTFQNGKVASFSVGCDTTTHGPLGR